MVLRGFITEQEGMWHGGILGGEGKGKHEKQDKKGDGKEGAHSVRGKNLFSK